MPWEGLGKGGGRGGDGWGRGGGGDGWGGSPNANFVLFKKNVICLSLFLTFLNNSNMTKRNICIYRNT